MLQYTKYKRGHDDLKTLKSENPSRLVGEGLENSLYKFTVLSMATACIVMYALLETNAIAYILR